MAGRKREDPMKRPWSKRNSPEEEDSAPNDVDDDNIVVSYPTRKGPDAMDVETDEAPKKKKEKEMEMEKEKGPAPQKPKKVRTLWETYFPGLPEFPTKASKRAAKKAKTTQPVTESTTDSKLRPQAQSTTDLSSRATSPSTNATQDARAQNDRPSTNQTSDPPTAVVVLKLGRQTNDAASQDRQPVAQNDPPIATQEVPAPPATTTNAPVENCAPPTNQTSTPSTAPAAEDLSYNPPPPGGFEHPGTGQRLEEPQRSTPVPRVLEGPGGPFEPPLYFRWDIYFELFGKYGPVKAAEIALMNSWPGYQNHPLSAYLGKHPEAYKPSFVVVSKPGSEDNGGAPQGRQPAAAPQPPSDIQRGPAPPATTAIDESATADDLRSSFYSNFPRPRARETFFQNQVGPLQPYMQPAPRGSIPVAGPSAVREMFNPSSPQPLQVQAPRDWHIPPTVQPPVEQQPQNTQAGSANQPGTNQAGSANQPIHVPESPEPPRRNIITNMAPPPRPPPRGGDVHEGWIKEQQQNQQQDQQRASYQESENAKHYLYPPRPPTREVPPVQPRNSERAGPSQPAKKVVILPVLYEAHYPANPPDSGIMRPSPLPRDAERLPDQSGGQRQTRSTTNRQRQQPSRPHPPAPTRPPPSPSSQHPQNPVTTGPDLATMQINLGMMRLQGGQPIAPLRNALAPRFGSQYSPQVQQQFQQRQQNTRAVPASSTSPVPGTQQQRAPQPSGGSGVEAASETLFGMIEGVQTKSSRKDSGAGKDKTRKGGSK